MGLLLVPAGTARAAVDAAAADHAVVDHAAVDHAVVDHAVVEAEAARVAVVERASSAAVAVFSPGGQGGGSAVVISPDGYALSNFHVTHECGTAMRCGMSDGKMYDAVIVGLDPTGDVALIKLLGREDFPYAEMADSDSVQVGDWCFAVGNPFLLATDFHPSVSYGVISGVHRYQYPAGTLLEYTDCLQADAAINPGNSGGPMFDSAGRVIGINGRGSFEKRGRVNVGVGYAISINQIKNFMGHLKSGRIVDHATLGASVATSDDRRVVVDDILEESDAARRGLRFGDELVSFAGRPISSVNAFKNVLGIFPKGWRVPLEYRRKGQKSEILVRLRGVHREAELLTILEKPKAPPRPKQKRPGEPKNPEDPQPKKKPREQPGEDPHAKLAPPPIPEIVQKHFLARPGYANYYFNQLNQDRVWKAFVARGDFAALKGDWTISGELAAGGDLEINLSDERSGIKMPGGELKIDLTDALSESSQPPNSGGLLVALGLWRRMLTLGPAHFGVVTYAGTFPLAGRAGLMDVLAGTYGQVESKFMFDPADGQLAAMEMYLDDDSDPCELYFSDYREVQGRILPHRIEVRHGDRVYQVFNCQKFDLQTAEGK
jgi:serine protease Do